MKTEELNAPREEAETLNKKLAELTGEELAQVSGGRSDRLGREFESEAGEFVSDAYKEEFYPYK